MCPHYQSVEVDVSLSHGVLGNTPKMSIAPSCCPFKLTSSSCESGITSKKMLYIYYWYWCIANPLCSMFLKNLCGSPFQWGNSQQCWVMDIQGNIARQWTRKGCDCKTLRLTIQIIYNCKSLYRLTLQLNSCS